MKKLLCVIMVAAMILSLATSVFATDLNKGESANVDVNAKYFGEEPAPLYSVDIIWDAMKFDYNASDKTWNSETHTWEDATASDWIPVANNEIKIKNHSSTEVKAGFVFEPVNNYPIEGIFEGDGVINNSSLTLEAPTEGAADVTEYVVTFDLEGDIPDTHSAEDYVKVGSITISLD